MNKIPTESSPRLSGEPELVFMMGVALRRLLILVDRRRSAARFASKIASSADRFLEHRKGTGEGPQ